MLALGAQLQLLPSNDPRSANIRSLLRQLGEDPATAMRLGLGAKSIQASQQGAGPGAGLSTAGSPDVPGSPFFSANTSASGEAAGPGAGGGGVAQPWASRHSSRRAMGGCGPAGQGSGVWKQPSGDLSWRSGGSCSCSGEDGEGRGGLAGAWRSSGGVGVGAGAGSPPAGAGGALEAMLGESSYRELRRASLRQVGGGRGGIASVGGGRLEVGCVSAMQCKHGLAGQHSVDDVVVAVRLATCCALLMHLTALTHWCAAPLPPAPLRPALPCAAPPAGPAHGRGRLLRRRGGPGGLHGGAG